MCEQLVPGWWCSGKGHGLLRKPDVRKWVTESLGTGLEGLKHRSIHYSLCSSWLNMQHDQPASRSCHYAFPACCCVFLPHHYGLGPSGSINQNKPSLLCLLHCLSYFVHQEESNQNSVMASFCCQHSIT